MSEQRMVSVELLEESLAAQERSLSWPSSYKGGGALGENGPYTQMRRSIDKLRAIIDGPGVESVAQWDESRGVADRVGVSKIPDGAELYLAAPSAPVQMKDHEKRELVNELTAIAKQYGQTQQIRERIARCVLPMLSAPVQAVPDDAFTDEELDSIQRVLFDNCGPATAKKVRAMLAAAPQPPKEIWE